MGRQRGQKDLPFLFRVMEMYRQVYLLAFESPLCTVVYARKYKGTMCSHLVFPGYTLRAGEKEYPIFFKSQTNEEDMEVQKLQ